MSPLALALTALAAFQVKHLLADFVWQSRWMVAGKWIYGHPAGLAHSGLHTVLSALVLAPLGLGLAVLLGLLAAEFAVHYHTDWGKEQMLRRGGLTPADRGFWLWTGLDQAVHHATYLAMVALALGPGVTL